MTAMENNEHTRKYEALAKEYGVENLCKYIPFSKEKVKKALEDGDIHLNSLSLDKWDKASGYIVYNVMGYIGDKRVVSHQEHKEQYSSFWKRGSSLGDRVCLLKHVAKYHYVCEE